jgi:hypothetical protein
MKIKSNALQCRRSMYELTLESVHTEFRHCEETCEYQSEVGARVKLPVRQSNLLSLTNKEESSHKIKPLLSSLRARRLRRGVSNFIGGDFRTYTC